MIPRTLVPVDVRPPSPDDLKKTARRTTTYMDDRTVVPTGTFGRAAPRRQIDHPVAIFRSAFS